MSVSIETFGIDQLSVGDRLDLIDQIWNSLPEELTPEEIPDWHLAELTIRRAAANSQPSLGKPWRDVIESLEAQS